MLFYLNLDCIHVYSQCIFIKARQMDIYNIQLLTMQKEELVYAKWDESIWSSVEKVLSTFQMRVAECMLTIGDLSKRNQEDYRIQACLDSDLFLGEKFYLELIRPFCVTRGYLHKNIPTAQDVASLKFPEEREEEQQERVETRNNQGKKKKAKKQDAKEEMKAKIIKENFIKDLQIVSKSHSMTTMQFQFGLKQNKIQLRLITFFYIAYFIRKNKVLQKIDQSQVFELINIMIKVIRIFTALNGPNPLNKESKSSLSRTLIIDLKFCVIQLKQHYRYTNKSLIIKYPKLVYYTKYDQFFGTLGIKPYSSQVQFVKAVKSAFSQQGELKNPTLVFYRTMIGAGKTSAALSLSQMVNDCKIELESNVQMQAMYSCVISSVRMQVGRYCYNSQQKFGLGAMEKYIQDQNSFYPRVINSWSCKNQKYVDMLISDINCTYQMLDKHLVSEEDKQKIKRDQIERRKKINSPKLFKQHLILFVDQPTAFCNSIQSAPARKLFQILAHYPPKLIILASATMPSMKDLPNTIELVRRCNPNLEVKEIISQQFAIGCQYCTFKGEVVFPHTGVKNKQELKHIIDMLHNSAFLLKLYTGPSLFFLLKRCEKVNMRGISSIDKLPEVRQDDIIRKTYQLLNRLLEEDDKTIQYVCELAVEETILDFKEEEEEDSDDDIFGSETVKAEVGGNYVDFEKMLREDAYKFLGGCLIGVADPLAFAYKYFEKWVKKIKPIKKLYEKYIKDKENLQKEITQLEEDQRIEENKKAQEISKLENQNEPKFNIPQHKRINTHDHYKRYCNVKQAVHKTMLIKAIPLQTVGDGLLENAQDFLIRLLLCGVAVYARQGLSPKYLQKVQELASSNFLAYIITDESLCYGTNFPISNVILCDELALKLNINEMFQLVGRAGRVGQSWTARAFLQPKGIKMLNDFIHHPQTNINQEKYVFETLARQHLDNPVLKLRTPQFDVRYSTDPQSAQSAIQILLTKRHQGHHLIRRIALVAFFFQQNHCKYLAKAKQGQSKRYAMPISELLECDLPTCKNSLGQDILNISLFYTSFKQFLFETINNAILRVLREQVNDSLDNYQVLSHFKPKIYQQFYSKSCNSLTILLRRKEPAKQFESYTFQPLLSNAFGEPDIMALDSFQKALNKAHSIIQITRTSLRMVAAEDAKEIKTIHEGLMKRGKLTFYRDTFLEVIQEAEEDLIEAMKRLPQGVEVQYTMQIKIALAINKSSDILNGYNRHFHVPKEVREIWENVEKAANAQLK